MWAHSIKRGRSVNLRHHCDLQEDCQKLSCCILLCSLPPKFIRNTPTHIHNVWVQQYMFPCGLGFNPQTNKKDTRVVLNQQTHLRAPLQSHYAELELLIQTQRGDFPFVWDLGPIINMHIIQKAIKTAAWKRTSSCLHTIGWIIWVVFLLFFYFYSSANYKRYLK